MVTDNQVRMLMKLVNREKLLKTATAKAGMSEKTARKYLKSCELPICTKICTKAARLMLRQFLVGSRLVS